MSQPTESTRLLEHTNQAQYVFDSSIVRERRVKQFQCCLCAIFLSILSAALVISVVYSINIEDLPPENSTSVAENKTVPLDLAIVLLNQIWPLSDSQGKNKIIDEKTWDEAIAAGKKGLDEKNRIENSAPSLQLSSASYRHQKVTATTEKGRNMSKAGLVEEYATRHLHRNKTDHILVETACNENRTTFREYCQRNVTTCNIFHKYRSRNGTCNNLRYPEKYGVAYRPFRRVLPPDYADGISRPRRAKNGDSLPSARTVSLVVHRPYSIDDPKFSVMLAVWGQFLDHDITATALSQKSNGSTISCCDRSGTLSPECFPVMLDHEDPLREYNISCIEFVRSAPAPTCCLGPREQLNQVTPFIDASVIYSADEQIAGTLRDFENGTMKVLLLDDGRALLPISKDSKDGCNREEEERNGRYCFLTGDSRSNENLHLTTMHLLWVRQHNLLAKNVSNLNSHWNDERIYQECRRIVAAQMQHITYSEFLPILLGNKLMEKFELYPRRKGYFHKYNESIDPTISNNFAAASFRFAHSIIPGLMKLLAGQNATPEYIQMHKMLFNPFELYKPGGLDKTLRGAMNTSIAASDSYFTDELKSHMFERSSEQNKQPKKYGLDLVSLNVQRGRDHGLPSYTSWREHCGLLKPRTLDDLKNDMDRNSLHNIKAIYKNVDDIDLYTGALSEKPIEGSILGPTITCLIIDQFYRLKYGDRFWYENDQGPQAFTNDQLDEIRKTTLANIICENSDNINNIQEKVMERNGNKNNYVPCLQIKKPDITFWKENLIHMKMQEDPNALLNNIKNKA